MWAVFAFGSAVFAALTSVLAKIGINGVQSNLATAVRTVVVLVMAWGMVFLTDGQGQPIGVPFWMQLANTMVSAPRLTSSRALSTAFFAGQPPQLINPIISMSSSMPSNTPFFSLTMRKSVVPGQ